MVDPNSYQAPAFRSLHYPLALCGIGAACYSFATTILWPLALYYSKTSSRSELGMAPDDYAGYVAYLGMLPFFFLLSGLYAVRNWWLLGTGMPKMKTALLSLVASSLIMAAPWTALALFFDSHRFKLPGDGNWPAISALVGLIAFHVWLLLALPKPVQIQKKLGPDGTSGPTSHIR